MFKINNKDKNSIGDFEKLNPKLEVNILSLHANFFQFYSNAFLYSQQLLKNMGKHYKSETSN